MQLRLSFERIFERFPSIAWTGKQKISPNALVHAISNLQVDLYGVNQGLFRFRSPLRTSAR